MSRKGYGYKDLLKKFDNDVKFKFEFYFNELNTNEKNLLLNCIYKDGDEYVIFANKKYKYYIKNYQRIFLLDNKTYTIKPKIMTMIKNVLEGKPYKVIKI